ncbi:hypothetical protein CU097_001881, partial [Rhizopus azygosporus]
QFVLLVSLGGLRLSDHSNRTKPSPGTAAVPCQTISPHSSTYLLATSGSSSKRTIDAVAFIAASVTKELKVVHEASQLMATFEPAKEPKAVVISFETGPSTTAPQATDITAANVHATSADNIEDVQDDICTKACPILFCQESHPLRRSRDGESVPTLAFKDTTVNPATTSAKMALSATGSDANTLKQFKIFTIISYYNYKQRTSDKPSETVTAWKTLLPLGGMLLANLKA